MQPSSILQYNMVKGSRNVLFAYCDTISNGHFLSSHPDFGNGGSIRSLLVHVANTYEKWIGQVKVYTQVASVQHTDDARQLFASIDLLVEKFLAEPEDAQRLQLFTHVITHEFHHKGQILSLSRHWGYLPVDTDIMR